MQLPDGSTLMHAGRAYDPAKAHQYYEDHKKLKGRKSGGRKIAVGRGGASVGKGLENKLGVEKPTQTPNPKSSKQKAKEAREKLDRLRKLGTGKSDHAARTAAEKSVAQGKLKQEKEKISEEVTSIRKDMASLSETLKEKLSSGQKLEADNIKDQLKAKKTELEAAAEKLRNLGKTKPSG